ncbi:hypothetical protein [Brevundimonas sp.]|uniref:hypothetical protein n=1 Tax=Brevundimonas sp. TaxID=1871086 RepID=UPI001991A1A5|nr:hypothetical protein [Brevundimonas sp.]MBD3836802.1 hypothetical protein [Brevundimonas sp.]
MPIKTSLLRSEAGVRLHRIEHPGGQPENSARPYRLSTCRSAPPLAFSDERAALDAFDLEVIAALSDPTVIDMQRRGLLD